MLRKTFAIRCSQGHAMTVSSFHIGLQVPCPTCQVLVVVPSLEELAAENSLAPAYPVESSRTPVAMLADDEDEPLIPLEDHAGLWRVRLGLAFFLADIIILALGFASLFGLAIIVGMQVQIEADREEQVQRQPGDKPAPEPKDQFDPQQQAKVQKRMEERMAQLEHLLVYGTLTVFFLTHALTMIGGLFCLSVPRASRARNLMLAYLANLVVRKGIGVVIVTMGLVQFFHIYSWLVLATLLLGPILLEMYLARLAHYLDRRDLRMQSLLIMISLYVLGGMFVAIAVGAEAAKANNNPGMQMLIGLCALGVLCACGIWFIFYVILLIRLRMAIRYALEM
jgi:hypothetical protein